MEKLKICAECQHSIPNITTKVMECLHPKAFVDTDIITGKNNYLNCREMRNNDCGEEGKLYEAKEEE